MGQFGEGGGRGSGRDGNRDRGRDGRSGRDRGGGGGGARGGGSGADRGRSGASREQKSYRAQLDRLFESGKIGELVASAEKARAFASTSGAPTGAPPQVTVASGKLTKNLPAGDTAAAERQRESRAGLGAELARAIARAEAGGTPLVPAPGAPAPGSGSDPEPPAPTRRSATRAVADDGASDAETRLKLIAKLRDAEGRDAITRATEALAGRFAIPDDFEILQRVLEHRDNARITYALERLGCLLKTQQPRRGRALAAQLRFLEETSDEPELRSKAAEVRTLVK